MGTLAVLALICLATPLLGLVVMLLLVAMAPPSA
jgi:hypothetical protein